MDHHCEFHISLANIRYRTFTASGIIFKGMHYLLTSKFSFPGNLLVDSTTKSDAIAAKAPIKTKRSVGLMV